MNENFNNRILALHQADADQQQDSLEQLAKDKDTEAFLERQALIGRIFKAGMEQVLREDDDAGDILPLPEDVRDPIGLC